jgi:hypothetical protein
MSSKTLAVVAILALALCVSAPAFASNLVTNGSFETGDFSGWTPGGNFTFTQVVSGPFYVYSGAEDGNFYATLGPIGADGTLSQTIATTPGQQYTFSFWLNAVGDNPSDFSAFYDGIPLFASFDPNTGNVWTEFTFSVTGTGSDTIMFAFRDDPAYIALDNISLSPTSGGVPEPASLLLLGTGLLGIGTTIRRKLGL